MEAIRIDRTRERFASSLLGAFLACIGAGLGVAAVRGADYTAIAVLAAVLATVTLLLVRSFRQLARPAGVRLEPSAVVVDLPGVLTGPQRLPRDALRRVSLGTSAWEHLHRPPEGSFVRENGLIRGSERPNCLLEFDPPVRLAALRPVAFRKHGARYTVFPGPDEDCTRLWLAVEDAENARDALAAEGVPCRWIA